MTFAASLAPASARAQQGAGDAPAAQIEPSGGEELKPKRKAHPVKKVHKENKADLARSAAPTQAQTSAGPPPSLAAAAAGGSSAPADIAAALKKAGAGTCANAVDAAAAPSMVGVTQSNTISTWSDQAPVDKRLANVVIGQRYGNNSAVPFGATAIIVSPTASGGCDTAVVQVVSSPLPCTTVRETIGKGKRIADIAGLQAVQNGSSNTLLMPTGSNTCVLIDYKTSFAR